MSGMWKHTTGLTGLSVSKNPRQSLQILYEKIIFALQKLPSDYFYRQYTEKIINDRAKVVNEVEVIHDIEKKIDCGQIEELILQANKELKLARSMLEWRSWEQQINKNFDDQWSWPPHS
ncbi:NADH dehydrogenase [ubiquinone] 1 alpha subcomplex subunit 5 [Copidosoma floridanum]|uniref:NADH dehydrogenase [ubiquinone] 1 alpha subcomplex subunit 5 n=1 Tax=Copidosoma floridanum TaxID=29053 RepID=UPI0006C9D740|nr:NADH dehydrogenase [ubiquinone] 1 alpha subcomplex subunit 5 [Copidosoma floridanum]